MGQLKSSRFREEIVRHLSLERMRPYLAVSGGDIERALHLYMWNLAASAAFFELLASVEVVVRNSLHEQLEIWNARRGISGTWLTNQHGFLHPKSVDAIREAEGRIARARIVRNETTLLTVLPFGFWRHMLSNKYKTTLWPFAMRAAFRHLPSTDAPKLFAAMAQLHRLRNRVAHHEPIHRRDLAADFAACGFVLGAVSPAVAAWATDGSRIPELLAARPQGSGG